MKTITAVQSFLYSRQSANRRPRTIKWYQEKLAHFTTFFPEDMPADPEPIEQFLAKVVPAKEDEVRHGYYRALKALYRFISRRDRLLNRHPMPNPMEVIDAPTRRRKVKATLTAHQLLDLRLQARGPRDEAILSLFIDNGIRSGEAASLRKQDIHEESVRVDGKSGEREVPISEETRRLLLALVADAEPTDHVFQGKQGPLTPSGIYQIVAPYMRQAGIDGPKMGPHRIRHAFGKNYIKNGGDTRSLQKIMGHAQITTTELYVELAQDDIVAKHHQFTPLKSIHAAAQESFFDSLVGREVEEILKQKEKP